MKNYSRLNDSSISRSNLGFKLSYNVEMVNNFGHPNIDNSAELYSLGSLTKLISFRYSYFNSWLALEIEPYVIDRTNISNAEPVIGTYQFLNNHVTLHTRTAFEDFEMPDLKRHLLRLWFSPPNSRTLDKGFQPFFRKIKGGTVRGGFPGHDQEIHFQTD